MFCSVHVLPVLLALVVTSASSQSLEERYWLALNEGRDLSEMHSVAEMLAGPGRQPPPKPEIRADALRLLDGIECTAPLDELAVDSDGVAPYVDATLLESRMVEVCTKFSDQQEVGTFSIGELPDRCTGRSQSGARFYRARHAGNVPHKVRIERNGIS